MSRKVAGIWTAIILFGVLTACSSEPRIDYEAVEVSLATEPESAVAGSPVELRATFTGIALSDEATVDFDIRAGEEPELIDAANEGDGLFTASYTFPEEGIQTVFLHLYDGDIHITKKKWLEIK